MTPNDVQLRKLRKRFRLLDGNGNGHLELTDYQQIAHRFQQGFGLPAGSASAKLIDDTYTRLFTTMHRRGDHNQDGILDEEEFITTSAAGLLDRPDGFERAILPVIHVIMRVCDKNDDASLDHDEFSKFITAEGADAHDRALALAHLYPAGVQALTIDQFTEAVRQFYCSPAPDSPGNWLFGTF